MQHALLETSSSTTSWSELSVVWIKQELVINKSCSGHTTTRFSYGYDQLAYKTFFYKKTCITALMRHTLVIYWHYSAHAVSFFALFYTPYLSNNHLIWVKYPTRSWLLKLVSTRASSFMQPHIHTSMHGCWILSNCLTSLPPPTSHTYVPGNALVPACIHVSACWALNLQVSHFSRFLEHFPLTLFLTLLSKTCAGWGTCLNSD